LITFRTSEKR